MIWEVFRKEDRDGYHIHCGNVHAPDREMALMFAQIQHARRKPTESVWVVPRDEIGEVDADETSFGGTTDKSYRWVLGYQDVDHRFAEEIAASESEQREADRRRSES